MVRRICMTLAVLAGIAAAVLLATPSTAVASTGCGTVINAAAVDRPLAADAPGLTRQELVTARQTDQACHAALVRTTALAGLAGLLCIGFGTVVVLGRSEDDDLGDVRAVPHPVGA
jgi:hypothetical protein